jgi:hypothetical protein
MGAMQVVRAFKQNITGGAFEALAAGTGDSLQIPAFAAGSSARLLEAWGATSGAAADFDIRSPDFHDNTRGLRFAYMAQPSAGKPQRFLPGALFQPLYISDVLTAEVNGTATNNVGLNLLEYFDQLPGASDQRLASWPEIASRMVDMVGIFVGPTAGAAGDYGAARALNADDDRLIANTDYAILGATSQLPCELLTFTGPETSGRKFGLPLLTREEGSGQWFVELSQRYQLPMIPIVNSNNKGNILFQAADSAGATVPHVTLLMAELR